MNRQGFNRFKSIILMFLILTCIIIAIEIVYFSKIKIYEDILITSQNKEYFTKNIEIIGKSVFDKEVVLSKKSPSTISLENYYLNNLTLIIPDSVTTNSIFQLQINNNPVNIDLNKPNKIQNNKKYYTLNYSTNRNIITKTRYVLKCNFVNFSNIFKEKILYKINLQSTVLLIAVFLAIVLLLTIKNISFIIHNSFFPNIIKLRKKKKIKFKTITINYSLYSVIISILLFIFSIHVLIIIIDYYTNI